MRVSSPSRWTYLGWESRLAETSMAFCRHRCPRHCGTRVCLNAPCSGSWGPHTCRLMRCASIGQVWWRTRAQLRCCGAFDGSLHTAPVSIRWEPWVSFRVCRGLVCSVLHGCRRQRHRWHCGRVRWTTVGDPGHFVGCCASPDQLGSGQ